MGLKSLQHLRFELVDFLHLFGSQEFSISFIIFFTYIQNVLAMRQSRPQHTVGLCFSQSRSLRLNSPCPLFSDICFGSASLGGIQCPYLLLVLHKSGDEFVTCLF